MNTTHYYNRFRQTSLNLLILCLFMVLTACQSGSGGDGDGDGGDNTPQTGIFIDAAVQGVSYSTSSGLTGTTDSSGAFTYMKGDVVSFSLSGISLGQAQGSSEITVLDIVGATQPSHAQLYNWLKEKNMGSGANALLKRALNISLFLQTLDEDNNPDNGIEITTATANKLSNTTVSLNFAKDLGNFRSQLSGILAQMNTAKAPRQGLHTVQHLVTSGVITIKMIQYTRIEYDTNADGTADNIYTYTYDDYGNMTRFEYDRSADGTADIIRTNTYNDYGNRTRFESDTNADGTADSIDTYTYDDYGNKTRIEYDTNADGTADRIYTYT
ncbi:hypothetical protein KKA14_09045, partial [bacterium]|nr:hypothetical protein [bacterium]